MQPLFHPMRMCGHPERGKTGQDNAQKVCLLLSEPGKVCLLRGGPERQVPRDTQPAWNGLIDHRGPVQWHLLSGWPSAGEHEAPGACWAQPPLPSQVGQRELGAGGSHAWQAVGRWGVACPLARGRGGWLRRDGEQVKALPCRVNGCTVCLWELGTCWQLPSQPARLPWSQGWDGPVWGCVSARSCGSWGGCLCLAC